MKYRENYDDGDQVRSTPRASQALKCARSERGTHFESHPEDGVRMSLGTKAHKQLCLGNVASPLAQSE